MSEKLTYRLSSLIITYPATKYMLLNVPVAILQELSMLQGLLRTVPDFEIPKHPERLKLEIFWKRFSQIKKKRVCYLDIYFKRKDDDPEGERAV